jgi:WD40 repeat protein
VGTTHGIAVVNLDDPDEPTLLNGSTNLMGSGVSGYISDRTVTFADGDRLIIAPHNAASENRGVFMLGIWAAATGEELGTLPESPEQIEHTGMISTLALSPDGRTIATGSMDHSIRLWDLPTRKLITTLQGHLNEIWALAFLPDGKTLVSGAKDGSLKLWPTRPETRIDVISSATQPLAFSSDGTTLAALAEDNAVVFINLATGDIAQRIPVENVSQRNPFMPGQDRASHLKLSADLLTLVQRQPGGWVKSWNTETGVTNLLKVADRHVSLLALSPNGRHLITASHEEMPRWWDLRAGTNLLWSVEIEDAVFSLDGRLLATEGREGVIQLWSATDREPLATLELPEPQPPREFVFSPEGSRLAATYTDHTIGLWDTTSGEFLGFFTGHKQPVFSIAFSPDGATLASAGADSTLRLWNVATRQELLVNRRLGANWRDLAFSPDGTLLVGSSSGPNANGIRFYKAPVVSRSEVASRTAANSATVQ